MTIDKSLTIKSILLKAWRERWSDVQWGIQIKTILPKGTSGDVYDLSEILMGQALIGPSPNALMLNYLKHSVASALVTHASVLMATSKCVHFEKSHCTRALLDLTDSSKEHITSRGRPDESNTLAVSLLHLMTWLVKVVAYSMDKMTNRVDAQNCAKAMELALYLAQNDFTSALLYISKGEERETFSKLISATKQLNEQNKQQVDADGKQAMAKLLSHLRNIDPSKLGLTQNSDSVYALNRTLQPILAFEALFNPTSDLQRLSLELYSVSLTQNVSFSDLVYKILHSCLLSISQVLNIDSLKWDAFILVKLPTLLDKLSSLMQVDATQLKVPTDLFRAFDKLLKHDALLNAIDAKNKCDIIKIMLDVVNKMSPPLLTETETLDVERKRKSKTALLNMALEKVPEDVLGGARSIELTLKAEAMMDSILKTLDTDSSKPDSMENLLGVLCHIIKGESFDLLLAAAAANGKLKPFVRSMIKFNQQSQESQGESVKNSLLRAALFDITFLMLVHVVQSFGKEVVLEEASGTLIDVWVRDMMMEKNRPKLVNTVMYTENTMVDNVLQQLNMGELRTQVVKWQNVCVNIHFAIKEMVTARALKSLELSSYTAMLKTACSKLCALPICIFSWMLNYKSYFIPIKGSDFNMSIAIKELLDMVMKEEMYNTDMPHIKERLALMTNIVQKMQGPSNNFNKLNVKDDTNINSEDPHASIETRNSDLKVSLRSVWNNIKSQGMVGIESAYRVKDLMETGGFNWFVSAFVNELLNVVYEDELDKTTNLIASIFHLDLEQCCLSLLRNVIPSYLKDQSKSVLLTDPHGTALAKLVSSCLYASLIPHQMMTNKKSTLNSGMKRSANSADLDKDSSSEKIRKTNSGISTTMSNDKSDSLEVSSVEMALADFIQTLQDVCEKNPISPITHFSVRFIEQCSFKGRKSRLVLQHLNLSLLSHLIKTVPEMFSMSFVAHVLDSGTSNGRRNMSKLMCMLRSIKRRIKLNETEVESS